MIEITKIVSSRIDLLMLSRSFFLFLSLSFIISCQTDKSLNFPPNNNNKLHVWVFIDMECPISQFYTNILNDYHTTFAKDSIFFYAVFPGTKKGSTELIQFEEEFNFKLPLIADPELKITHQLNATVTPEVFVTRDKEVLYQGMIDNSFVKLGERRGVTDHFYLKDALQNVISSKNDYIKKTKAIGCVIEK